MSLCNSYQVAWDKAQVAVDLGVHLPKGLRDSALGSQLQTMLKYHSTTSTSNLLKGRLNRYLSPTKVSFSP